MQIELITDYVELDTVECTDIGVRIYIYDLGSVEDGVTAVSRTGLCWARAGWLGTAYAAFTCAVRGIKVHGLQCIDDTYS